jgi:hypothetical protein
VTKSIKLHHFFRAPRAFPLSLSFSRVFFFSFCVNQPPILLAGFRARCFSPKREGEDEKPGKENSGIPAASIPIFATARVSEAGMQMVTRRAGFPSLSEEREHERRRRYRSFLLAAGSYPRHVNSRRAYRRSFISSRKNCDPRSKRKRPSTHLSIRESLRRDRSDLATISRQNMSSVAFLPCLRDQDITFDVFITRRQTSSASDLHPRRFRRALRKLDDLCRCPLQDLEERILLRSLTHAEH